MGSSAATIGVPMELSVDQIQVDENMNCREYGTGKVVDLMDDIITHSQLQPVGVRSLGDDTYQLVFGFRRFAAIKAINEEKLADPPLPVLAMVMDGIEDKEAFSRNVAENVARKTLTAMDRVRAMDRLVNEFGYSQKEVAARMGCSQATVSQYLKVLEAPAPVRKKLADGKVSVEAILEVLSIEDPDARAEGFELLKQEGTTKSTVQTTVGRKAAAAAESEEGEGKKKKKKKARTLGVIKAFFEERATTDEEDFEPSLVSEFADSFLAWAEGKKSEKSFAADVDRLLGVEPAKGKAKK